MQYKYILIDIDKTLFLYFFMTKVMEYEASLGLLDKRTYQEIQSLFREHAEGNLDYVTLGRNAIRLYSQALSGKKYQSILQADYAFAVQKTSEIAPFFKDLLALTKKDKTIKTVLVTSEPRPMATALAVALGVHNVISSQMEIVDDLFTGHIDLLMTPEEKLEALIERDISKDNILAAFGDSISDRDMLALAKHPFCMEPSPELRKIAEENNWTILTKVSNFHDYAHLFSA